MAAYYGVVRDNHIELEGGARLAEGTRVEVHIRSDDTATRAAEEALLRDLLAEGLLEELPIDEAAPEEPFEPVVVRGEPLSEQIIEERR